jgi:type IV pilus assembly protein PilP
MIKFLFSFIFLGLLSMLTACSGTSGYADLDAFMKQADQQKGGRIEPLPEMVVYKSFAYSEAGSRSPFTPPAQIVMNDIQIAQDQSNVKPDLDRPKEVLEYFQIGQLNLVGTLQKDESPTLWGLVSDGEGGIHRVKSGQYMGKNHGRVVAIYEDRIDLIEIVPNGNGGWIERPRTVALEDG